MLRPESTALAAVVVLFIIFTILSPKLFPYQADVHQPDVGGGRTRHRQHRRHAPDDRRTFRPLGRRRARAHLLCRRGADARLRAAAADRRAGRGRRRRRPRLRQRRAGRPLPHPLLRRHARHDADLARRPDRADRRLPDDRATSRRRSRPSMAGPLLGGFRMSMLWFFVIGARGDVPAVAHPVRQLDPGRRPEPAGGAQPRRAGRSRHASSCS